VWCVSVAGIKITYVVLVGRKGGRKGEGLTGSTVTRIVASRATMKDIMERDIMMNHSFLSGFHFSYSTLSVSSESVVEGLELSLLLSILGSAVMDSAEVTDSVEDFGIVDCLRRFGVIEVRLCCVSLRCDVSIVSTGREEALEDLRGCGYGMKDLESMIFIIPINAKPKDKN
jgi:hypothetical protein